MVPSKCGLISITFFTVCEEMYGPMDARESTAMMTPPLKMNPRVVVPWLGCRGHKHTHKPPESSQSVCCVWAAPAHILDEATPLRRRGDVAKAFLALTESGLFAYDPVRILSLSLRCPWPHGGAATSLIQALISHASWLQ
jgi:hypothetical protein